MTHTLEVNQVYEVRHRTPGQRYDRRSVMLYLGVEDLSGRFGKVVHLFSARPVAGTQALPNQYVVSVRRVPAGTERCVSERWIDRE